MHFEVTAGTHMTDSSIVWVVLVHPVFDRRHLHGRDSSSLGVRCFIIEHCAAYGADKEGECLEARCDQFVGKLLMVQRDVVNATNGRVRVLLPVAMFGHEVSLALRQVIFGRSHADLHILGGSTTYVFNGIESAPSGDALQSTSILIQPLPDLHIERPAPSVHKAASTRVETRF